MFLPVDGLQGRGTVALLQTVVQIPAVPLASFLTLGNYLTTLCLDFLIKNGHKAPHRLRLLGEMKVTACKIPDIKYVKSKGRLAG